MADPQHPPQPTPLSDAIDSTPRRRRLVPEPTVIVDDVEKKIPKTNEVLDRVLQHNFGIPEEEVKSVRKDLTIHLMRSTIRYMQEKALQENIPATAMWSELIDARPGIHERAIARYEAKANQRFNISLDDCEGHWFAEKVLHQGWNNRANPRKRKLGAQERRGRDRFSLSPTPPPPSSQRYVKTTVCTFILDWYD